MLISKHVSDVSFQVFLSLAIILIKVISHGKNLKMCTTLFRDWEREGAAKTVYRACLQGGKVTETPAKRVVSWVEYYPWSLLRLENDKSSSSQALRVALIIGDVKLNAVRIQVFTILV